MLSNVATALVALTVGVNATESGPWGGFNGYNNFSYKAPAKTQYKAPSYGLGYGYKSDTQPTYAWQKGTGYGIYDQPRTPKPLIANDGYRVKKRSDPAKGRAGEEQARKCIINDPNEENHINGVIHLSQGPYDKTTSVWGEIWGLDYNKYDLRVNALGDLRDGCDGIGGAFNPTVTASGYSTYHDVKAPGLLGDISNNYGEGKIDVEGDFDLSGNHDVTGRAMSVNFEDAHGNNVVAACCVIGFAAPAKKEPVYNDYGYGYGNNDYGYNNYGYDSYSYKPSPKPAYKPAGYGYAAPRNNYW